MCECIPVRSGEGPGLRARADGLVLHWGRRYTIRAMCEDAQDGAVTDLLLRWSTGEQEALAELMPLVHANLVRLAAGYLRRERPGHTLQTQALVNEAFLSMVQQNRARWNDRAHFFAIAVPAAGSMSGTVSVSARVAGRWGFVWTGTRTTGR